MGGTTEEQEAAWKQLSTEIGGELITRRERGRRFIGRHLQLAVIAKAGTSPIALDLKMEAGADTVPSWFMTRIRAPYVARDTFSFSIKRLRARLTDGALLRGMAKLTGRHTVEPGDLGFDRDFLITANDTAQVRALLADPGLCGLIQSQPAIDISAARPGWRLFKKSSQRLSVLRFEEEGVITDVLRLKSLFELFRQILNQLCQIGSASPEEPTPQTLSAYRRDWLE
jgi:hypothetical protein